MATSRPTRAAVTAGLPRQGDRLAGGQVEDLHLGRRGGCRGRGVVDGGDGELLGNLGSAGPARADGQQAGQGEEPATRRARQQGRQTEREPIMGPSSGVREVPLIRAGTSLASARQSNQMKVTGRLPAPARPSEGGMQRILRARHRQNRAGELN